jgi:hypothetical protein
MFGSYTAFEVEAERRREVLANSMRDSRRNQPVADEPCQDATRPSEQSQGMGLAEIAANLVSRIGQRV